MANFSRPFRLFAMRWWWDFCEVPLFDRAFLSMELHSRGSSRLPLRPLLDGHVVSPSPADLTGVPITPSRSDGRRKTPAYPRERCPASPALGVRVMSGNGAVLEIHWVVESEIRWMWDGGERRWREYICPRQASSLRLTASTRGLRDERRDKELAEAEWIDNGETRSVPSSISSGSPPLPVCWSSALLFDTMDTEGEEASGHAGETHEDNASKQLRVNDGWVQVARPQISVVVACETVYRHVHTCANSPIFTAQREGRSNIRAAHCA